MKLYTINPIIEFKTVFGKVKVMTTPATLLVIFLRATSKYLKLFRRKLISGYPYRTTIIKFNQFKWTNLLIKQSCIKINLIVRF